MRLPIAIILLFLALVSRGKGNVEDEEDIEIVGLGDDCGDSSICDPKSNLVCKLFECVCDEEKKFVLDGHSKKCVSSEGVNFGNGEDHEDETEWKVENGTNKPHENSDKEEEKVPVEDTSDAKTDKPEDVSDGNTDKPEDKSQDIDTAIEGRQLPPTDETKTQPEPTNGNAVGPGPNHDEEGDDFNLPIDDDDSYYQCQENSDCTTSSFGKYSQCLSGSCVCNDTDGKQRRTVLIQEICYIWKTIESECESDEECDANIIGPAICHTDQSTETEQRFCACRKFHIYDPERKECLPVASEGISAPCVIDEQCNAAEALGPLGRCSELTGLCECFPPLGPTSRAIYPFQNKCFEERSMGDFCTTDQECEASLGRNAICDPETRNCGCLPGRFCSKLLARPQISVFTLIVLIAMCVSTFVGVTLCYTMRKRGERYTFISQQNDA